MDTRGGQYNGGICLQLGQHPRNLPKEQAGQLPAVLEPRVFFPAGGGEGHLCQGSLGPLYAKFTVRDKLFPMSQILVSTPPFSRR